MGPHFLSRSPAGCYAVDLTPNPLSNRHCLVDLTPNPLSNWRCLVDLTPNPLSNRTLRVLWRGGEKAENNERSE